MQPPPLAPAMMNQRHSWHENSFRPAQIQTLTSNSDASSGTNQRQNSKSDSDSGQLQFQNQSSNSAQVDDWHFGWSVQLMLCDWLGIWRWSEHVLVLICGPNCIVRIDLNCPQNSWQRGQKLLNCNDWWCNRWQLKNPIWNWGPDDSNRSATCSTEALPAQSSLDSPRRKLYLRASGIPSSRRLSFYQSCPWHRQLVWWDSLLLWHVSWQRLNNSKCFDILCDNLSKQPVHSSGPSKLVCVKLKACSSSSIKRPERTTSQKCFWMSISTKESLAAFLAAAKRRRFSASSGTAAMITSKLTGLKPKKSQANDSDEHGGWRCSTFYAQSNPGTAVQHPMMQFVSGDWRGPASS